MIRFLRRQSPAAVNTPSNMTDQKTIVATIKKLRPLFAHHGGSLEIGTPYHMLVLVILSARTRDEQVLKLAPGFFKAFPTVERLAKADLAAITAKVNTVGMYKQKAKNLQAMAKSVVADFGGEIPSTIDELTTLAGVGRKTASVILVAIFDTPAIAVDTHVFRVVHRLGWAKAKTPAALEAKLLKIVPRELQADCNRVFVPFGRAVCTPTPRCWMCPVRDLCAYPKKNLTAPDNADAIRASVEKQQHAFVQLKDAARESLN